MAGEIMTTIVGHLGGDPELRFTPSGAAVTTFSVASTPRRFERDTQEWVDGDTTWVRCNVWREHAENVAESLIKGSRVIVTGRLANRRWETDDGETRFSLEMQVDEVGPALKYATAKVTKAAKANQPPPPEDPWGSAPARSNSARQQPTRAAAQQVPVDEEPPF